MNKILIIFITLGSILFGNNVTNDKNVTNNVNVDINTMLENSKENKDFKKQEDGNECYIKYINNLADLKAKCYVQHNKKRLFGLVEDKLIIDNYYESLFPDFHEKTHMFKEHCDNVNIKIKKEYLEGKILKCEIEIDKQSIVLPNNSLNYSMTEIKSTLPKDSSLEIENFYTKSFEIKFDDNEFQFSITSSNDFEFDKSDIQYRFDNLPKHKKYLTIYNGELNHIGIETSMKIEVNSKKECKVLGLLKNDEENEILLLERNYDIENLRLNILSRNDYTINKLYGVNRYTQDAINKFKQQIVTNTRKKYEKGYPRLSFVSNKQNKENQYSMKNNKMFLNLLLETHKNFWFDLNYEIDINYFKLSLIPILEKNEYESQSKQ